MFEFEFPWIFFIIPLPFLIYAFLPPCAPARGPALKLPFYQHLSALSAPTGFSFSKKKFSYFFLIWSLLIIAFANPRWVGEARPFAQESHHLMLALDLSGSMQLPDMQIQGQRATRLDVIKNAAADFIQKRSQDKIGLVLFGTRAYLQTPLTYDHVSLLSRLEEASVGLAGPATSIGDAIGLSIKHLKTLATKKGRSIILLTDGANTAGALPPLKAAELAKLEGIKIYTIGLEGEEQLRRGSSLFFQNLGRTELDEKTLKQIAKITEGKYFPANNLASLQKIYEKINKLEASSELSLPHLPEKTYYIWPLALALLLLVSIYLKQLLPLLIFKKRQAYDATLPFSSS